MKTRPPWIKSSKIFSWIAAIRPVLHELDALFQHDTLQLPRIPGIFDLIYGEEKSHFEENVRQIRIGAIFQRIPRISELHRLEEKHVLGISARISIPFKRIASIPPRILRIVNPPR